jgi:hypothetical protein
MDQFVVKEQKRRKCHENDSELHDVVKKLMNLDNIGVALPRIDRNKSEEEHLAIKMAEEDIKYDFY